MSPSLHILSPARERQPDTLIAPFLLFTAALRWFTEDTCWEEEQPVFLPTTLQPPPSEHTTSLWDFNTIKDKWLNRGMSYTPVNEDVDQVSLKRHGLLGLATVFLFVQDIGSTFHVNFFLYKPFLFFFTKYILNHFLFLHSDKLLPVAMMFWSIHCSAGLDLGRLTIPQVNYIPTIMFSLCAGIVNLNACTIK